MKNANEILKDIYNQVKKLYADADENQKGAAVGYDDGFYAGEGNAYAEVLSILKKHCKVEVKSKKEMLLNRIHKEQEEYRNHLKELSPNEIINHSYKTCYRDELISLLESEIFSDEVIDKLLELPSIIDFLYDEWLGTDGDICEMLREVVNNI